MNDGVRWWDLRQTLIWIATRDSGWVTELRPKQGLFGREEHRDAFDFDFACARLQDDVLQRYAENDGSKLLKSDLIDALAGGDLIAVEHGARLAASNFLKASVGDDYVGTRHTGFLSIFRLDWRQTDGVVATADAPYWQPLFLAEQVRGHFPPVGSKHSPISEAGIALLARLDEGSYGFVKLERSDETEIEATAKRRLADEYDAAQERGEVQGHGGQGKRDVPEGNLPPAKLGDIGLTRKDIHEARTIRDSEVNSPGMTANGAEWWRGKLDDIIIEAAGILRTNRTITKDALLCMLEAKWPEIRMHFLRTRVLVMARVKAGLPKDGTPGKRSSNSAGNSAG